MSYRLRLYNVDELTYGYVIHKARVGRHMVEVAWCGFNSRYVYIGKRPKLVWSINSIRVKQDYRGKGIGTQLLKRTLREMLKRRSSDVILEAHAYDGSVQRKIEAWYRRNGFRIDSNIPSGGMRMMRRSYKKHADAL